jgi:hypothetical protein
MQSPPRSLQQRLFEFSRSSPPALRRHRSPRAESGTAGTVVCRSHAGQNADGNAWNPRSCITPGGLLAFKRAVFTWLPDELSTPPSNSPQRREASEGGTTDKRRESAQVYARGHRENGALLQESIRRAPPHAARCVACHGVRSHPVPRRARGRMLHPRRVERRAPTALVAQTPALPGGGGMSRMMRVSCLARSSSTLILRLTRTASAMRHPRATSAASIISIISALLSAAPASGHTTAWEARRSRVLLAGADPVGRARRDAAPAPGPGRAPGRQGAM